MGRPGSKASSAEVSSLMDPARGSSPEGRLTRLRFSVAFCCVFSRNEPEQFPVPACYGMYCGTWRLTLVAHIVAVCSGQCSGSYGIVP